MSEERPRKPFTVLDYNLNLAESRRQDFVIDIPAGTPESDLVAKEFLMHVSQKLNQYDRVECRWEDGSKVVNLRVLWAERAQAKVAIINREEYGSIPSVENGDYTVKWRGPHHKFTVLRGEVIMQTGFNERPLAEAWISENRV